MATVEIKLVEGPAPLYAKYPTQAQPQGAFLEICPEDGDHGAAYWLSDGEIGNAVPSTVWRGRELRVGCSPELSADQVGNLSAELRPLIDRVVAGYACEWDGSNHRGSLDEDATQAIDQIEERLRDEAGDDQVWDAGNWLGGGDSTWVGLCADAGAPVGGGEDAQEKVVAFVEDLARGDDVILDDTDRAVESLREIWEEDQDED